MAGAAAGRRREVLDLLGRITPARTHDTYGALRAAQTLAIAAAGPRAALPVPYGRDEREVCASILARAMRISGGDQGSTPGEVAAADGELRNGNIHPPISFRQRTRS